MTIKLLSGILKKKTPSFLISAARLLQLSGFQHLLIKVRNGGIAAGFPTGFYSFILKLLRGIFQKGWERFLLHFELIPIKIGFFMNFKSCSKIEPKSLYYIVQGLWPDF